MDYHALHQQKRDNIATRRVSIHNIIHVCTFLVNIWTSLDMISRREVISEAMTSAKAALSRDILRVSDSSDTQRLKVERTSVLCTEKKKKKKKKKKCKQVAL